MKRQVRVIVLRTAGTNCDAETAYAFTHAGAASAELVHVNQLASGAKRLADYHILAIPGGFTYGDDIASGKILANEVGTRIGRSMRDFIASGRLAIGICNGFQVLVKAGLLPDMGGDHSIQEVTLTGNDSVRFEDRWVYLKKTETGNRKPVCVWTRNMPEIIYLPVAHAEGKFVPRDKGVLRRLREEGLIVFTYCDEKGGHAGYPLNPNGSVDGIAGICDRSGRIFGLMPHPERHIVRSQHPRWPRGRREGHGDGYRIFRNGIEFAKKYVS